MAAISGARPFQYRRYARFAARFQECSDILLPALLVKVDSQKPAGFIGKQGDTRQRFLSPADDSRSQSRSTGRTSVSSGLLFSGPLVCSYLLRPSSSEPPAYIPNRHLGFPTRAARKHLLSREKGSETMRFGVAGPAVGIGMLWSVRSCRRRAFSSRSRSHSAPVDSNRTDCAPSFIPGAHFFGPRVRTA